MSKLLPCPFCGGEGDEAMTDGDRYYGDPYYHPNFCDRCGGMMDEIVLIKEDAND